MGLFTNMADPTTHQYAATRMVNGFESVLVTLPLERVPGWNPQSPQPNTYLVDAQVQPGWIREQGGFVPPGADQMAAKVRAERDRLLKTNVDTFNALRWESLPPEQQQLMRAYRQALLDVPEQSGFPWTVQWPQMPL